MAARQPDVNAAALERELLVNPDVIRGLAVLGEAIAEDAKVNAEALGLRDSGAGIRSIRSEIGADEEGPYVHVSWDQRHFYMAFHELGTSHENAKPFLRPAADKPR
jgi:HK97 gp10 family phage protein